MTAAILFLLEYEHTEEEQLFRDPGKFQTALGCQFGYINAVGRHTTDLLIGVCARLVCDPLAWIAQ